MGSYKCPNVGYNFSCPTYNPLTTTHEPPSTVWKRALRRAGPSEGETRQESVLAVSETLGSDP